MFPLQPFRCLILPPAMHKEWGPCCVGFLVTPKKLARGAVGGDAPPNIFPFCVDGFSLFASWATRRQVFYVLAGHEWHGSARSWMVNEVGVRGACPLRGGSEKCWTRSRIGRLVICFQGPGVAHLSLSLSALMTGMTSYHSFRLLFFFFL